MKLLLTSQGFGNSIINKKLLTELSKAFCDLKMLLIPTALSGKFPPDKYLNELFACGFTIENIIIFNENEPEKFCNLNIDILYVCGGNTFTLVKLIKECGFDKQIINYLTDGVVYIGRSAGAHLVTRNIEHILDFDENYIGVSDFNALGLFDGIVFCHYRDEIESNYTSAIKAKKYKVYKITNEEMIVFDDNKIIIV